MKIITQKQAEQILASNKVHKVNFGFDYNNVSNKVIYFEFNYGLLLKVRYDISGDEVEPLFQASRELIFKSQTLEDVISEIKSPVDKEEIKRYIQENYIYEY